MNLRTQEQIIADWKNPDDIPAVSVICTTFNHKEYIEKSIHGFLIQETSFPFEILIHDDASTDGTPAIVKQYQEMYPKIIKTILQTENQYSKGVDPNALLTGISAGKYFATCEGDDYWLDPKKLQIQYDYLETHPDIAVTSHDAYTVNKHGEVLVKSRLANKHKRDYTGQEMMRGKAYLLFQNLFFRRADYTKVPELRKVVNADVFLSAYLGQFGGSHYHDDIKQSCHLRNDLSAWSGRSNDERLEMQINTWFWRYKYFQRIGEKDVAKVLWRAYIRKVFANSAKMDLFKEFLIKLFSVRELYHALKSGKSNK